MVIVHPLYHRKKPFYQTEAGKMNGNKKELNKTQEKKLFSAVRNLNVLAEFNHAKNIGAKEKHCIANKINSKRLNFYPCLRLLEVITIWLLFIRLNATSSNFSRS